MTQPTLRGRRRILARVSLGLLAVSQVVIGGWALLAPWHFFLAFPSARHAWVALLPPYNEHLVRDVGALNLALVVVLGVAAVTADRRLVRVAAVAFAVYTVPHTLFHGSHLEGFSLGDGVAQMSGFVLQLLLAAAALGCTFERIGGPGRGQL